MHRQEDLRLIESHLLGKLCQRKASLQQMWVLIVTGHFTHSNGKLAKGRGM